MSEYRDDTQDTAVAWSETWAELRGVVEDFARATAVSTAGVMVLTTCSPAEAFDKVMDHAVTMIEDTAQALVVVQETVHASEWIDERAQVKDSVRSFVAPSLVESTARAFDDVIESAAARTESWAQAFDLVDTTHFAVVHVEEYARASDAVIHPVLDKVEDTATAFAEASCAVRIDERIEDAVQAFAETYEGADAVDKVGGLARCFAETHDRLSAVSFVSDIAVLEDSLLNEDEGQAWTSNADTWAMSRYAPYTFSHIAVIDGVLYGVANDGVYRLTGDRDGESIDGRIVTGQLSMSGDVLVKPVTAYIEYELDWNPVSSIQMSVTTTQTGVAQTYTYQIESPEVASALESGRFKFGRGLRGRHFSYSLHISGKRAYINDLRVDLAKTSRRV